MTQLTTTRLRLDPITEQHFDDMMALNGQEVVMRYISGSPQTAEDNRAAIARIRARWEQFGFGWWAIYENDSGRFIGMACLQHLAGDATKPHELGWRLDPSAWGKGYATEAAQRIAQHAFEVVGVPFVVAVAHPDNAASQAVMRRLGMRYLGIEWHYERDVATWRIDREEWEAARR